ncbi:MAG: hypothetical protein ACREMX_15690 [Gemmatimonadales bacterium]
MRPSRVSTGALLALAWGAAILYTVALSALSSRLSAATLLTQPAMVKNVVLLLLWGAATPAILWSAGRLPLERTRWARATE